MQAERVATGWATVWILALVAEVAMLIFLASSLRAAQPVALQMREASEIEALMREIRDPGKLRVKCVCIPPDSLPIAAD